MEPHAGAQPPIRADDPVQPAPSTVLDRLWIWTHPVGAHDNYDLGVGRKVRSRMTPEAGARFLGVSNLYFIHFPSNPPPAGFRDYVEAFRPMKRVVLSLTGAGGETSAEGRETVINLARERPNISGFVLDDFLHWRADTPAGPWLAENQVRFPVTLMLTPPSPVGCERLELVQTSWTTGDYRAKEFAVEISERAGRWREVHRGRLANEPGARSETRLPGASLASLRIRILNSYDARGAMSCGLGAVRLWANGRPVALSDWKASASSTYSEKFAAENLLDSGREEKGHPASRRPLPASLSPAQLKELKGRISASGRPLPISCVIYDYQISPRILPHVDEVDEVAFWTWKSEELKGLEANLEKLERIVRPKPIVLGCYLFDYGNNRPMSVERMKHQCELGLRWLKEGRVEGIIFLASNVCDQDLPAVEWTRVWIASVKDQAVPAKRPR